MINLILLTSEKTSLYNRNLCLGPKDMPQLFYYYFFLSVSLMLIGVKPTADRHCL